MRATRTDPGYPGESGKNRRGIGGLGRSNGANSGGADGHHGRRLFDRIRALLSGGRVLFFRRAAAVMLALLAGILAFQPRPGPAAAETPTLTLTRDLPSGHVLDRADLAVRQLPADLVPHGYLGDIDSATGRLLGGAARSGEVVTDTRLVGPELTGLSTGEEDAAVPVRLDEPSVAALVHPGRRVDIVTTSDEAGRGGAVLAERAPVIAVRPTKEGDQGPLLVVGLPQQQAAEVAAASVVHSLTITLR